MSAWIPWQGAFLFLVPLGLASPGLGGQNQGGVITGTVRDAHGAAAAGVAVHASSPVLTEEGRTTTTDREGRYRILDLGPGVYALSFSLGGFEIFRRDGIELTSEFTAVVDAELRTGPGGNGGAVSGAPVVDTTTVSQQAVTSREVMDSLPTDRTFVSYAAMTPGMQVVGSVQNVGGSLPENALMLQINGSRIGESRLFVDGMSVMSGNGTGGLNFGNFLNNAMVHEVVVSTGAMSAEFEVAGVTSNIVTRAGSNVFRGTFTGRYTNAALQGSNLSADLIGRGLSSGNRIEKIWDINPSAAGPIIRDRLWVFSSARHWGTHTQIAGLYHDADPAALFYTPDLNRPALRPVRHKSVDARPTLQLTRTNRVNAYVHLQHSDFGTCVMPSRLVAPSACARLVYDPQWFSQVSWTSTLSSNLVVEAGGTVTVQSSMGRRQAGTSPTLPALTESSSNFTWRAPSGGFGGTRNTQSNYRASVSFVKGAHTVKGGLTLLRQWRVTGNDHNGSVNYTLQATIPGVLTSAQPTRLTQFAEPAIFAERVNYNLGMYVQNQWIAGRLTLDAGARLDLLNAQVDPQHLPAGLLIGERTFAAIKNVPNWSDLSPRLGVAYDLFGRGKTALKATLGRYVGGEAYGIARAVNPLESTVNSATRTWSDTDGDFTADCDLKIVAANNECGAANPDTFGQTLVRTRYDPARTSGFGVRPYNWGASLSIQHQLFPRILFSAGYGRRWYGNFGVTQNLEVTNADFRRFCITSPIHPDLPGSGTELCGFSDVSLEKFGRVNDLVGAANRFGTQEDVYDGFDATLDMRLPRRVLVSGGVNAGRQRTNNCFMLDDLSLRFTATSPRTQPFCDVQPPFRPTVKLQGVYWLPWELQTSATFQSLPGPQLLAQQETTNAQIAPSLGRNLASCGSRAACNATLLLDLIPPGTIYGDRLNQIDVRVSRTLRIGGSTIRPTISIYNLLNANPVLQYNTRFNSLWPEPTAILTARFVDFGVQVEF